jgi:hypothetical protein
LVVVVLVLMALVGLMLAVAVVAVWATKIIFQLRQVAHTPLLLGLEELSAALLESLLNLSARY